MLTDQLKQQIVAELERRRDWLDRVPSVRSVSVDVKFNEKTGVPRTVIIRLESEG